MQRLHEACTSTTPLAGPACVDECGEQRACATNTHADSTKKGRYEARVCVLVRCVVCVARVKHSTYEHRNEPEDLHCR